MQYKAQNMCNVNGLLRKIGNTDIIDVNERKACYAGREMEGRGEG